MMILEKLSRSFAPVFFFPLIALLTVLHVRPLGAETASDTMKIIAFGDSLTAGYLLRPEEAFPAQLQMALLAKGHKVRVENAGVSGDTTSGGLERLAWTLQGGADAVILELGANDALRGIAPEIAASNLDKMLSILKSKGIEVLVAGMRAPGNWGPDYVAKFDAIYAELAKRYDAVLYPFFLEGVARLDGGMIDPKYVQPDGLHPTAAGVAEIVKRMLPDAEALIARAKQHKAAAR
jgi:acyl-CoA thioesterase-1